MRSASAHQRQRLRVVKLPTTQSFVTAIACEGLGVVGVEQHRAGARITSPPPIGVSAFAITYQVNFVLWQQSDVNERPRMESVIATTPSFSITAMRVFHSPVVSSLWTASHSTKAYTRLEHLM